MNSIEIVKLFKDLGNRASFHYADDSCEEWGIARKCETQALNLFDNNEHLQDEMREVAKGFLWRMDRPEPMRCQSCGEISLRFKGRYIPPNGAREWECDCGYIVVLPRSSHG